MLTMSGEGDSDTSTSPAARARAAAAPLSIGGSVTLTPYLSKNFSCWAT
jgi:hypothetical protein